MCTRKSTRLQSLVCVYKKDHKTASVSGQLNDAEKGGDGDRDGNRGGDASHHHSSGAV